MPAQAELDKWRSSSQTQAMGYKARSRSSAIRAYTATGLTNNNTILQQAIDQALTQEGGSGDDRYHPSDTDLPLAAVTARHYGGTSAMGEMHYRRVLQGVDLTRSAKSQADRSGSSYSFRWWRDTTSTDGDGRPAGSFIFHPHTDVLPEAQKRPLSWTFKSGIMYITMTTLLDTRPSITWADWFWTINSNADSQWLETGGFPAKTLLFLPYTDRYVDGRYLVQWKVAYNPKKWQYYSDPVFSGGSWGDSLVDAFPVKTFYKVPVHL